jgi:hypothetical protein|nr:MAG: replication associated protein [ssDNA virus sp.]
MDLVAPPAPRAPRPRAQSPEAKHWCFTYNNPTMYPDEMIEELEDLGVTYAVFQLEEGKNGTPHYQGYVAFKKKKRLTAIEHLLRGAGHWEISLGSPTQNRDYCTKDDGRIGDFSEIGTLPAGQGSRTDLVGLHSALKDGLTQADYANEYFSKFIQYPNLVQNYVVSTIEARDPSKPFSSWLLIGPAGTGKSRLARELGRRIGNGLLFRHSLGKWFDGYRGERTVLLDDFCGSSLSFTQFKCLLDRYPFRVELKGTSCEMAATNFIITTNDDPKTWWQESVTGQHGHSAIFRRLGKILFFVAENQFRVYNSYAQYARDELTPRRDGEIFYVPTPIQEVVYNDQGAQIPEEILQAQVP